MFEPTIKGKAKREVQCNLHHQPTTSFLCGGKLVLLISLVFIDHWLFRVVIKVGGVKVQLIFMSFMMGSYYCSKALKIGFISIQLHCINSLLLDSCWTFTTHTTYSILLVNPKEGALTKDGAYSYLQKMFLTTTKCLL
jgi:hypothetical protein